MLRRWGHQGNLDLWTALSIGAVDEPELRAVRLLSRLCDPYRFSLYCLTGVLPARGNMSGAIYLIDRTIQVMAFGGVLELEDGFPVRSYCINVGGHDTSLPPTDAVLQIRNIIEGEERAFKSVANCCDMRHLPPDEIVQMRPLGAALPFEEPFFPRAWLPYVHPHENAKFADFEETRREIEDTEVHWEADYQSAIRHALALRPENQEFIPYVPAPEYGQAYIGAA